MNHSAPPTRNERAARRRLCSPPRPDGSMRFWRMEQLWELAAGLPVMQVVSKDLPGFDEVRWFGGPLHLLPTCSAVAEHARDIYEADLTYPIILSPSGEVLDGMHRICKARLLGIETMDAVQLKAMPEPRGRVLPSGEEVMCDITPVAVVAYDPRWPQHFAELHCVIAASLGDLILAIEHVGSTAVPGLPAKPIIDLDLVVDSAALLPPVIERLDALGYRHMGDRGIAGREAFARRDVETPYDGRHTAWPPHHLYVHLRDGHELMRHLRFRDHLRSHPIAAAQYGALKLDLAQRFSDNRGGYAEAKTQFIEEILAKVSDASIAK